MVSIRTRLLATAIALAFAGSSQVFAADGDATEALLKEAKFDYKVIKPGLFRVPVETKEGSSIIIIEEVKVGKDSKGNDSLAINVLTQCYSTPADYKPTNALLTWVCEINGVLMFGSVNSYKDKDGSTHFLRSTSMLLKNADMDAFIKMIAICHFQKFEIGKQLKALVEATN